MNKNLIAGMCAVFLMGRPAISQDGELILDRPPGTRLRIVSYNIYFSSIFPTEDGSAPLNQPDRRENFARIAQALKPDIWAFQEVLYNSDSRNTKTEESIHAYMEEITGEEWYMDYHIPGAMLFSKYPITWTHENNPYRGQGVLIDLPESISEKNLFMTNVHLATSRNVEGRFAQARALSGYLADIVAGNNPDVPRDVMIHAGGDFNSPTNDYPYRAISSLNPDISGSGDYDRRLVDPEPRQLGTNSRSTSGSVNFNNDPPTPDGGTIDFVLFGPDTQPLQSLNSFILNTLIMEDEFLEIYGLNREDVALQPDEPLEGSVGHDHLPLIHDLGVEGDTSGTSKKPGIAEDDCLHIKGERIRVVGLSSYTVELRDITGKRILIKRNRGSATVVLPGLSPGLYLVTVKAPRTILSGKLYLLP